MSCLRFKNSCVKVVYDFMFYDYYRCLGFYICIYVWEGFVDGCLWNMYIKEMEAHKNIYAV
jgi:hypothetical protein